MIRPFSIYAMLILWGLSASISSAQQRKIDSLLTRVRTDPSDTTRIKHLIDLCWAYKCTGEFDKGMLYGEKALHLSDSVYVNNKKGWPKQKAQALNDIGIIAQHQGKYELALKSHFEALKIRKELGFKKATAQSYNNIGIVYDCEANYEKALQNFLAAITIDEEVNDKRSLAGCYANVGVVYKAMNRRVEAMKNYQLSLKMYQELNDKKGIANSYNNLGVAYFEEHNPDKALDYYAKALELNKELGDQSGIATMYMNMGVVNKEKSLFDKALENYSASLKISDEIGDKSNVAVAHINIGEVYYREHKFSEARTELLVGLKMAGEIGSRDNIAFAYDNLAHCDSAAGNWKDAYRYERLFKETNDSLFNAESAQKTAELSTRYESEKKEGQIRLLEKDKEAQAALSAEENKRSNTILISVVAGLSLMILFSIFLYNRYRITQKQKRIIEVQKTEVDKQRELADSRRIIAEEQRQVIQIQKSEVEKQKTIVEEHQREIIDSITYAKRLQEAILPPDEYVRKNLPESFILYKPKDIVAGDFYWMEVKDDILFIAAADCTGHGVPGAMVSIVCSNALNRTIKEFGLRSTGAILDKVTELVTETFEKSDKDVKDGMDISLLAINRKTKEIQWSGANNPLWYISQGELKSITANKQPIGKHDHRVPFTTHRVETESGTILYLFTDGFADQFGGPKGKKFKYKQLEEKLLAIHDQPMQSQRDSLDQTLQTWKGKLEQVDDVCILGIKLS